jgi:hypothetical protein
MENEKGMNEMFEALAKAQGKIKAPLKNRSVDFQPKQGPRVKYNYADLADVIDCIRLPLSENGLSVIHRMTKDENGLGMVTELVHAGGGRLSTWYPLPDPSQMRPQEFGSALTYGRRYSLSALLGIASEEDDDGAAAAPPRNPPPRNPPKVTPKPPPPNHAPGASNPPPPPKEAAGPNEPVVPNGDEIDRLVTNFRKVGVSTKQILERYSLKSLGDLTVDELEDLQQIGQAIVNKRATIKEYFVEMKEA